MSEAEFDRLSAQDNSFLVAESSNAPMHVSAVGIFEVGNLATRDGGVDIKKFKRAIEAQLHRIPRYRQKLMWVPVENRPVWVDDEHFKIDYHIRHAALPRPGGVDDLKKLTARITTRELDRSRPLWEIWVIEGLEGDRFAMVSKIHHCMIDGDAGANVAQILFSPIADDEIEEPIPWQPRPLPSDLELVVDAAERVARAPFRAIRGLASLWDETEDMANEIRVRAKALRDFAGWGFTRSTKTPLNGELGPHRRVDWLSLPLADVKAVSRTLDCTINDIVLATVTGAVRHYLIRRGERPALTDFRISAPVSTRGAGEERMGNKVSAWIVRLPIEEDDPVDWVSGVKQATVECKTSRQALGVEMLMQAAEFAPSSVMGLGARLASGPINMIVTNVPGPPFPLYMLGANLLELHPLVPLLDGTGLGIALFSYDGRIHVGLNADYDLVPDLDTFTALFAQSFMALADAAEIEIAKHAAPREEKPLAQAPDEPDEPRAVVRPPSTPPQATEVALSASAPRGSSAVLG